MNIFAWTGYRFTMETALKKIIRWSDSQIITYFCDITYSYKK